MKLVKIATEFFFAAVFFIISSNDASASEQVWQTKERQSPVQKCEINSTCVTVYNHNPPVIRERIGEKLAIRSVYLIPAYDMSRKVCPVDSPKCRDLHEVAFVYLEIQSIWPEAFLLTASKVGIKSRQKSIKLSGGMHGSALDSKITSNWNPGNFLFRPGEIKLIGLSQGIKLDGVLGFFTDDVLSDLILEDRAPVFIPNISRVADFNRFLRKSFGRDTLIQVQLFEKDYRPLLTTEIKLGEGGDLFAHGDVSGGRYQFKHDAFIGEVLYQLRGGTKAFDHRVQSKELHP